MTFLNDDELSRLRSEFSVLLPETVTIQRPVNTVNVYGDTVTVWVTRATTTGRLDPEGTRRTDFVVAVREEQRDYFTLTLAYDADIEAGDRVVISSIQYEVLTLHETHTKKAVIRCRVVEFTSDVESDAVLAATFTASYASAGTATPVATAGTNVLWYWGDGETSTGASPSHEYTTAGTKTILMYDADNVNALDMSSENLTAAEVDWSKITGARSVDFSGNSMNAAALLNVLQDIYTYRSSFTFPNPTLDITGGSMGTITLVSSVPGDGVSDSNWTWDAGTSSHIPQTAGAYIYALENDPNLDGFSTWTITYESDAVLAATFTVTTTAPSQTVTIQRLTPTEDVDISWGDGSTTTVVSGRETAITHVYASAGTYTLTLPKPTIYTHLDLRDSKIGGSGTEISKMVNLITLYLIYAPNLTWTVGASAPMPTGLTTLQLNNMSNLTWTVGASAPMPTGLTYLFLNNALNLTWTVGASAPMPTGLTFLYSNNVPNVTWTVGASAPMPTGLTYLNLSYAPNVTWTVGASAPMPTGLTSLYLNSVSNLTWTVGASAPMPTGLTSLYLNSVSNVTWTVGASAPVPTGLTFLQIISVSNVTSIDAGMSSINAIRTIIVENALDATALTALIDAIYANRASYTWSSPSLDIAGGGNASPGGTYAAACPPSTDREKIYELVNDSCGDGHNLWSITYTA